MTDAVRREFEEWQGSKRQSPHFSVRASAEDAWEAYQAGRAATEEKLRDYNSAGDILAEITGCYDQSVALWELADRVREMYGQLNRQNKKLQQSLAYAEGQASEYRARYDAQTNGIRRVMAELAEAQKDGERLDWLDEVNRKANERNGTVYGWRFDINHNRAALMDHNWPALSIRAAIDAAINKGAENV